MALTLPRASRVRSTQAPGRVTEMVLLQQHYPRMHGTRRQSICYALLPDPDDDTESDYLHLTRLDNLISVVEQQD